MRINSVTNVSLIFGVISDTIINVVVSLVWLGGGRRVLITDIRLLLRLTGSRLGGVGILLLLLQRGLLQVRSYGGHLVIGLLIAIHAVSWGSRSGGLGRLLGLKLLYLLLGLVDILPWKLVTARATCSKLMKTYPLSLSSLVGLPVLQLGLDLFDDIGYIGRAHRRVNAHKSAVIDDRRWHLEALLGGTTLLTLLALFDGR